MMLLLNYTAYTPFGKLMRVLQAKGFVNKDDRPTVWKVKQIPSYIASPSHSNAFRGAKTRGMRSTSIDRGAAVIAVAQVLVAYIYQPFVEFWTNLLTRSPAVNLREYVLGTTSLHGHTRATTCRL
jgi:hypothetical protein